MAEKVAEFAKNEILKAFLRVSMTLIYQKFEVMLDKNDDPVIKKGPSIL